MKKRYVVSTVVLALGALSFISVTSADPKTGAAAPAGKTYSGMVYVAGMGGHFAKADVTVDPGNANEPVKINNLDRVVIGDKTTHPTHD
ncbi:MAG TPA: hypothetical protein VI956_08585, partial [Nitrospirota bacterium]|nr:hypothetical protein [Nitrospirota bacterium]